MDQNSHGFIPPESHCRPAHIDRDRIPPDRTFMQYGYFCAFDKTKLKQAAFDFFGFQAGRHVGNVNAMNEAMIATWSHSQLCQCHLTLLGRQW